MTPFTALYYKEYREHRLSLFVMFCLICTIPAMSVFPRFMYFGFWLQSAFLYALVYVTATAAMSYAKEDEAKTVRFLRMLPINGGTLLRAKLAWLATVMFTLFLPLVFYLCYALLLYVSEPYTEILLQDFMATLCVLSWAFFWTTRYPSKIFATLLSCLSAIALAITILGAFIIIFIITGYGIINSEGIPVLSLSFVNGIIVSISLPIGWFGLRRMAGYYQQAEPEPKNYYHYEPVKTTPRLLTRLFPKGRWSPFTAMLWQSIGQSYDILLLGLFISLAFCLEISVSLAIYSGLDGVKSADWENSYFGRAAQTLAALINFAFGLNCLSLSATIFSRDQEGQKFRTFTNRGISPRLVWWSRILPFAAVYAFPLLFIGFLCLCEIMLHSGWHWHDWQFWPVSAILVLSLLPFSIGSFFSLFCRSILMSVILTFGIWLVYFCAIIFYFERINLNIPPMASWIPVLFGAVSVVAFPIASQLMVGDWLKEKPRWQWMIVRAIACLSLILIFGINLLIFIIH